MPRSEDLYGNAPDNAATALLLIDVINDLDSPEGEQLLRRARPGRHREMAPGVGEIHGFRTTFRTRRCRRS